MRGSRNAIGGLLSLPLSVPAALVALVAIGVGQAAAVAAAAIASSRLVAAGGASGTWVWLAVLIGAAFCGAFLRGRERVEAEAFGQRVVHGLRARMFEHLLDVTPSYLRNRRRGATIVRFFGDLQALRRWVSLGAARLVVSGTTLLACIAVLVWFEPRLAAAVTALLGLFAIVVAALAGSLEDRNRDVRRRRGQLANLVTEQVTAQEVTRMHGRQRGERRRLDRRSRRLGDALVARARRLGFLDAATYATTALLTGTFVVLVGYERDGGLAPAEIVATLVVVALLAPSLRELARVFEYRQAALVALDRLDSFLAWPSTKRVRGATALENPSGAIEYREVRLSDREPAFSARIAAGEHVALGGDNGVGKSTLLELTAGLLAPQPGTIVIGGQPLERVAPESLHRHVALVSLDLPLVRGTLRRNLFYHHAADRESRLERVIELCGLDELIARLDAGLDTRVAEAGRNLSQGERQRIALARALMAGPSVLLLDEVDAHLDAACRRILARVVRGFDGIVLAVTHDSTLLEAFDRSIVLGSAVPVARDAQADRQPLASVGS